MSSVPSMNLFNGPEIKKTQQIHRPFGTLQQNYYQLQPIKSIYPENYYSMPSYNEDYYYQQQMNQTRFYPEYIEKPQPQIKYQSPFETLYKYEKTNPTPRDAFITPYRQKELTDEEIYEPVPIIDLIIEQQRNKVTFFESGLPKGYLEKDYQRELENKYNNEIKQQINMGYKLEETRTKKDIDQFYRSMKVDVDERGRVQINNIKQPEKIMKTPSIYKTTEDTTTAKINSNLQPFDNNNINNNNNNNNNNPFQQNNNTPYNQLNNTFTPYQNNQYQPQQIQEDKAPSEKNSVVIPLPGDSNLQQSQLDTSKVINNE